ncbi:PAS domain-containing protein [Klenkia terrae]|uniref:PAS domain-containing protein n=1 Tax=Klenkia terrae TaxID=1052259 RepID=UPI00361F9CCF
MTTTEATARARTAVRPTGVERSFGADELIVSKTDRRGVITYANDVFLRVGAYSLDEVIGQPHNLIRHPEMPRAVFHLLWDTISRGHELFAYINNLAADGAHYWVLAHVTPSVDERGTIVGYHSNRRRPSPAPWPRSAPSTRPCSPRSAGTPPPRPPSPPPPSSWTGWWPRRPPATRT